MEGYWLNAKTATYIKIYEHAFALKEPATASALGLSAETSDKIRPWHAADPKCREAILRAGMKEGLIRIRRYERDRVSFEFTIATPRARQAIRRFLRATGLAGPRTALQINNVQTGKRIAMMYEAFVRRRTRGGR